MIGKVTDNLANQIGINPYDGKRMHIVTERKMHIPMKPARYNVRLENDKIAKYTLLENKIIKTIIKKFNDGYKCVGKYITKI